MASLKQAIKVLDPSPDKTTEITQALGLLTELCEQTAKEFDLAVEEELGDPATYQFIAIHKEYRAYTTKDAGKIATEVARVAKEFIPAGRTEIVDGIAMLTTEGVQTIVGAGTGDQQQWAQHFIVVELVSLFRYDIRAWSTKIEATAITSQIEKALVFGAYKSTFNVKSITLNAFLSAYAVQLEALHIPRNEWSEYLADAKTAFFANH